MANSGATPTKSIRVHEITWLRLHGLKSPGESFDAVINRKLDSALEAKQRTPK